jgi:F-type H+-transporting ATPase subunit b
VIEINSTIIWQFANFLVLLLILNAVLYRPLRNIVQQRTETIDGSLKRAKDLDGEIQGKMDRYQEQLEAAKHEAGKERAAMREDAARKEGQILGEARDKAAEHIQKIRNQVAADAERAAKNLEEETRAMAGLIATKVLGREV